MSRLPDYLLEFHNMTGIDPAGWRAWQLPAMFAVSGIPERVHAVALRDFFVHQMAMAAELNEPATADGTWGVVAVPLRAEE